MMLLGLVIHSAMTYNVTYHGDSWFIKDPETTHIFSDFMVFFIHSFRIPIFFLLGGFFGAMLFYERGVMRMVKNRISRIVFPFIVFLFLLWPFIIFAFSYTNAVFLKQDNPLVMALEPFKNVIILLPRKTSHLWFLYYLAIITGTFVIIGHLLAGNFTKDVMLYYLYTLPIAIIAILLGGFLNKKINTGKFKIAIYFFLIIIGISLIIKSLFF